MVWVKMLAASALIAFSGWIARTNPRLGGFVLALPLTSMIALAFQYLESRDAANAVAYAQSTFVAVPLSLLYFVPFLLADRLKLGFWGLYLLGTGLLGLGYLIHSRWWGGSG